MDAQPQGLLDCIEPRQAIGHHEDAPAAIDRIDVENPAGDQHRTETPLERWRLPLPTGLADQREAGAKHYESKCSLARQRALLQRPRANPGRKGGAKTEPQRRLEGQREIDGDAGAKANRQPQQPPLAFGGVVFAERLELLRGPCRGRAEPDARDRRIRHHCPAIRGW